MGVVGALSDIPVLLALAVAKSAIDRLYDDLMSARWPASEDDLLAERRAAEAAPTNATPQPERSPSNERTTSQGTVPAP